MTGGSDDRLIRSLSNDLMPVRRLRAPAIRTLGWLAVVGLIAAGLAVTTDVTAMACRLVAAPDMCFAVVGSAMTAVLATFAAFQLDLPDRKWTWALLPLPAAAIWVGASGLGCLRSWLVPDTTVATLGEAESCLIFILGFSLPLSALLLMMLRRGFSLHPNLAAAVGGLAAAAAAATLLNFIHPYDAAATDLVVHAASVGLVVMANQMVGGRLLSAKKNSIAR